MDRYSILAISVVVIIVIFPLFGNDDSVSITGFAENVTESNSGFIFFIQDENGNSIKAFCSDRPDDSLHSFSGSYSEDNNIFFVSEFT